jgi:hypothetical protein
MFKKILIANRGEIALRVITPARSWELRRSLFTPRLTGTLCMCGLRMRRFVLGRHSWGGLFEYSGGDQRG